jgi:hypothetical protein
VGLSLPQSLAAVSVGGESYRRKIEVERWPEILMATDCSSFSLGGNYCPLNSNTRGRLAVFLVKTFGL